MRLSKRMKVAALCYLRFDKQMPLVATECGFWNADVMGIDEKSVVELEIKISKSDLKADFTKKADKHFMYMNPELTTFTPNKFYFLVTKELEFEAIKLVEEKAPRYGVLVYEEKTKPPKPGLKRKRKRGKTKGLKGEIRLAKKAYNLHDNRPSPQLMDDVLKRSSSELCRTYLEVQDLSDKLEANEGIVEGRKAHVADPFGTGNGKEDK